MTQISAQQNQNSPSSEAKSLQRMRWFLLIVILIWLLGAMITTVVVIYLTKSLLSLSLFSLLAPPAYLLYWIAKHLFPMDERRYKLETLRIQHAVEKQYNKQRIST